MPDSGQEFSPLTVDETLVPFFKRAILATARAAGPGRPGKIALAIRDRLVDDPERTVGLGVEQVEEEIIPEIRDTIFGGGDDPDYRKFVKRYLNPMGIDGRTGERPRNVTLVQEGLF